MARGAKLDLFIGAQIDEGWSEIASERKSSLAPDTLPHAKHELFFKKEKRNGKTITLVGEFFLEESESARILKELKKKLGCGGTFKEGWMEFQGDIKEKIRALLVEEAFRFKPKH